MSNRSGVSKYRHQRMLRSTLAAEAASLDRSEDAANYFGSMLAETMDSNFTAAGSGRSPIPVYPVTDARSLFDAIHRISTTFMERRVEIDVAALRENCRNLPHEEIFTAPRCLQTVDEQP